MLQNIENVTWHNYRVLYLRCICLALFPFFENRRMNGRTLILHDNISEYKLGLEQIYLQNKENNCCECKESEVILFITS